MQDCSHRMQGSSHSHIVIALQLCANEMDPSDPRLAMAVHVLCKPNSMSWSNVPDYMHPKDFHAFAKTCSFPGTVHYLHTMNWPKAVIGSSCLDYLARHGHDEDELMQVRECQQGTACDGLTPQCSCRIQQPILKHLLQCHVYAHSSFSQHRTIEAFGLVM